MSPAVDLAEKLGKTSTKKYLTKDFLPDNGSTAVEIALKVAIQYWYNQGLNKNKTRFMAFNRGYHGDTFGAMSVGFSSGFYEPFKEDSVIRIIFL